MQCQRSTSYQISRFQGKLGLAWRLKVTSGHASSFHLIQRTAHSGGVGVTSEQEIFQILTNRCESIEGAESNGYAKTSTYSPAETHQTKRFNVPKVILSFKTNYHCITDHGSSLSLLHLAKPRVPIWCVSSLGMTPISCCFCTNDADSHVTWFADSQYDVL